MSRSPWRDALDGQIKVLRELRRDSSLVHLARNGDVGPLRDRYPDKQQRSAIQLKMGETLAEALSTLVREAEPIHLTHDIRQELDRRMDRISVRAEDPDWDLGPLTEAMLPIPNGLFWFGQHALKVSDVPNPEHESHSVHVKAIYFGSLIGLDVYTKGFGVEIEARTRTLDQRKEMGVLIFLDARPSGYDHTAGLLGDHLVPCILGGWGYGETLNQAVAANDDMPKSTAVNDEGTKILAAVTYAFLHETFMLMLQRLTRWGGVGLNREEQKEAERERLRPRVQLVTWRKANYQYPEGHIPVPKNWSCRWPVTEHYRHYKSGKTVKIQSYVKGPHDKPFRGPTKRAHQVKY